MKLIAAVFGIAAVLIVVWAVLWIRGSGKRSGSNGDHTVS